MSSSPTQHNINLFFDELDLGFAILFSTGDDPREWSTISDIASMANSVVGVEVEQDPEALPLLSIEATVCQ